MGLVRWPSSYEHLMLVWRSWVWFPAPTWQLLTLCDSSSLIQCPLLDSQGTWVYLHARDAHELKAHAGTHILYILYYICYLLR